MDHLPYKTSYPSTKYFQLLTWSLHSLDGRKSNIHVTWNNDRLICEHKIHVIIYKQKTCTHTHTHNTSMHMCASCIHTYTCAHMHTHILFCPYICDRRCGNLFLYYTQWWLIGLLSECGNSICTNIHMYVYVSYTIKYLWIYPPNILSATVIVFWHTRFNSCWIVHVIPVASLPRGKMFMLISYFSSWDWNFEAQLYIL